MLTGKELRSTYLYYGSGCCCKTASVSWIQNTLHHHWLVEDWYSCVDEFEFHHYNWRYMSSNETSSPIFHLLMRNKKKMRCFDLKNLTLTKSRHKLTEIGIRHINIKKERENDVFSSILRKIGEDSKNLRNTFIASLGNNCRNKFSQRL